MKKTAIILLTGILIGSTTVLASNKLFSDLPSDAWFTNAVQNLSEKGIIQGYPDGTFKASNNVNRAELAVMLDRLLEHIETGEVSKPTPSLNIFSNSEITFSYPSNWKVTVSYDNQILVTPEASTNDYPAFYYPMPDFGLHDREQTAENYLTIDGIAFHSKIHEAPVTLELIEAIDPNSEIFPIMITYSSGAQKDLLHSILESITFL